ncbi:MAG: sigma-70 family RNA polymerase sigma factor [Bacteroidales bacterium]|nr:sigma-70 family RNA polymerase sigma factor [Bacteroidales bacterium]
MDNNYHTLTDIELIALYKESGDKNIIGVLFKRYTRFAFSVCMKYFKNEDTSKDAVMQIFEDLINKLQKHEVTYFKSWLYSVCKNHCLLAIRANKKILGNEWNDNINSEDFMENTPFMYPDTDEIFQKRLSNLDGAIQKLSKEQRLCVELFYLHDKSYEDISKSTNYDLKKVKSYIQNGKRNLKILLLKQDE